MHAEKSLTCPGPWERLLACTDGSDEGQNAVAQALSLAQVCGSKLYVLQVVEIVPEFEAVAPDLRTCLEEEIRRQKAATASEAALKGVQLDYRVLHSVSPFAAIVEEAEKIQPNLIILGRYGRTALVRLFMGSSYRPDHDLVGGVLARQLDREGRRGPRRGRSAVLRGRARCPGR